jgi:tryptophanyl-tRNA synthetase
MSRILTGIQATGTPHLGNLLGAIIPAIELSKKSENESFLFIANMHSLTQIKNAEELKQNTYEIAAAWLACGLDTEKTFSIDKAISQKFVNFLGIYLAFFLF